LCVDTACAKNVLSGQWFNFDDSSVSAITEESVVVSRFIIVIVSLYLLSVSVEVLLYIDVFVTGQPELSVCERKLFQE